jgi:hypothetical protein
MSELDRRFIDFERAVPAYLFAVTSAAFCFAILSQGVTFISNNGFETSTANSIPVKALHLLVITCLLFFIGWFFSFFTALIPFGIGIATARWFNITHWFYFVAGAAITAVAIIPLFISIPTLGINVLGPEPSIHDQFLSSLPYFLVSGSIAGIVCWRYFCRSLPAEKI